MRPQLAVDRRARRVAGYVVTPPMPRWVRFATPARPAWAVAAGIAVGLLPRPLARSWARLERAGILIVILIVFLLPRLFEEFGVRFDPVGSVLHTILPWAMRLVLSLAGHHLGAGHAVSF